MSFPVEAPPESPGHVGHTPQHVDVMLVRARVGGILSSVLARVMPQDFALHDFRAPQRFAAESTQTSFANLAAYQARAEEELQPWPGGFREGLDISTGRTPFTTSRAPGSFRRRF